MRGRNCRDRRGRLGVRASRLSCLARPRGGLVDRTRERARAVATESLYGAPLSPLVDIWGRDFDELAGAAARHGQPPASMKGQGGHRCQRSRRPAGASRNHRGNL